MKNSIYIWGLIPTGSSIKIKQWEPLKVKSKMMEGNPIKIRAGAHWYAVMTDKGYLYTWGEGKGYRTGLGLIEETGSPQLVQFPKNVTIKDFEVGHWHGLALTTNGDVYGWGKLFEVQKPVKLDINFKVVHMACGLQTSALVSDVNELYMIGSNERMQLGIHAPVKVKSFTKVNICHKLIKEVSMGAKFTLAITLSGEVYGWGKNTCGELGKAHIGQCVKPRLLYSDIQDPATHISCSVGEKYCHYSFTTMSGKCFTQGSGYKAKLGHGNTDNVYNPTLVSYFQENNINIMKPINGGIHSACIGHDHKLYTFGCGSDGRLGHAEGSNYVYLYKEKAPRPIEALSNLIVDADFHYYTGCALTNKNPKPTLKKSTSKVTFNLEANTIS